MKKEYQQNKLVKEVTVAEDSKKKQERSETFKAYKEEYDKYKDKKELLPKKGKSREDFTLQLLNKFKRKLENMKEKADEEEEDKEKKEKKTKENSSSDSEDSW